MRADGSHPSGDVVDVAAAILAESMVPAGLSTKRLVEVNQVWKRRRGGHLVRLVQVHRADGIVEACPLTYGAAVTVRELIPFRDLRSRYLLVGTVQR